MLNLKIKKKLNMPDGIKRKLLNVNLQNLLAGPIKQSLKMVSQ